MAEVHRQIQVQMEEMVKVFRSELLTQLEQKSDLDVKYLSSALRKHQAGIRGKTDSISKCHSELKKLRRKSQMSKNPQKYGEREMQFVEMISCMQCELDQLVAMGYTEALVEERRRYCFLVDRQCAVWRQCSLYHVKVKELLSHKLLSWQSACSDPGCIPERALTLAKQTATSNAGPLPEARALDKTLGVPADQLGGSSLTPSHISSPQEPLPVANGEMTKRKAMEVVPLRVSKTLSPSKNSNPTLPPPPKPADSTSNTLPLRTGTRQEHRHSRAGEHETLPRSPATLRLDQPRVRAIFSHQAAGNETLLSFQENDIITLLVPEERDGWHYGESQVTNHKGWFPYAYTEPLQEDSTERRPYSNLQAGKFNSSSTSRLDKVGVSAGSDCPLSSRKDNDPRPPGRNLRTRPFSMMNPDLSQLCVDLKTEQHSPRSNPFANVRLKRTVTNDRSAPAIR
ncbi:BAR/IMD domain-containing adapter protein 2-like [Cetorhinus maximus]